MTREQLQQFLGFCKSMEGTTVEMYFAFQQQAQNSNSLSLKHVVSSQELQTSLKELFSPILNLLRTEKEFEVYEYDPLNPPSDSDYIWSLSLNDVPNTELIKRIVENKTYGTFDSAAEVEKITCIVYRFYENGSTKTENDVYIVTKFQKSRNFRVGKRFLLASGSLKPICEPVLNIDEEVDCFFIGEKCLIVQQRNFEFLFEYNKERRVAAEETLNRILEMKYLSIDKIDDIQSFKENLLNDTKAISKLNKVEERGFYLNAKFMEIEEIIAANNLDFTVKNQVIILEKKSELKELLKIYDDDYLVSESTKIRYLSHSKRKI